MKLMQTKFIVPIAIVVLLLIVLGVYFIFSGHSNKYYLVTNAKGITLQTPVLLENMVAGTVKHIGNFEKGQLLVEFELEDEYSIPSNSKIQIRNTKDNNSVQIKIIILASKNYLSPGDTIYLNKGYVKPVKEESIGAGSGNMVELVFRIQVLVSESVLSPDAPEFKGVKDIVRIPDGHLNKYYTGEKKSLKDAQSLKKEIVSRGMYDAFIVPFADDERISIDQAIKFEK